MEHMEVGGGVAVTYFQLEKQLREQGHDVKVLSSWNGSMDTFSPYMYPKFKVCSSTQRNFSTLRKEISKADRVVLSDEYLAMLIILECVVQGKPLFYGLHTDVCALFQSYLQSRFTLGLSHILFSSLYKFVGLTGNQLFTTSKSFNQKLENIYGVTSKVINQSFKEHVFLKDDPKETVESIRKQYLNKSTKCSTLLLYAGRLSKEKRIPLLVDCKPKDSVLLIIGDGQDSESIKAYDNGNDIRVICRMIQPEELRLYYKAADLFVSASNFETYGMTCHESLVCKTPVVVENAQGYRSQVRNGDNGFLAKFEDCDNARATIIKALQNSSLLHPRVTCKSGVNIIQMITSSKVKGSFWISLFFGRLMDLFLTPALLMVLVVFEFFVNSKTHELKKRSKTTIICETCVDALV